MSSTSQADSGQEDSLVASFRKSFGGEPAIVARAPGRVNLIGEHTDYNDGFVLPLAIDRSVRIAARPRPDRLVVIDSLNYSDRISISLDALDKNQNSWQQYLQGVAWALKKSGVPTFGWEGAMIGDVPIGAGLSSSAALELCVARVFCQIANITWQPTEMARLCQGAENEWVGVNCGIMDQLISAVGVRDHAVLIDCRSLEISPVPLPAETSIIVLDTGTRRGLVDSEYNARRLQCEAAAAYFGVKKLRDVSLEQVRDSAAGLDPLLQKRAHHVVSENDRTLRAAQCMRIGDARALGQLMNESHTSLRDDFEVSSAALNTIVDLSQRHADCLGARLTGAGFGGCAIALVRSAGEALFVREVAEGYRVSTGNEPTLLRCAASAGAGIE